MRQLSKNDALFLASESAHSNSNVSLVQIYDPSTAPAGKLRFKSILALVQSRLHRSPVFRQKLRSVPLGIDEPYWIEDENFDLEYHVRNVALPKPGDWRQFCIQTSRIHARPLDLNRPLWELYVIEGLDSLLDLPKDSFALLTKLHNAAIDVRRGTAIITLLHDMTPEPPQGRSRPSRGSRSRRPARSNSSAAAWRARSTSPGRLTRPLRNVVASVAPAVRSFASRSAAESGRAPGDALQLHRVALPGVRDAALPARRVPRDPPARPARDGQRRHPRRVRRGAAPLPRGNEELPERDLSTLMPVYVRDPEAGPGSRSRGGVGARDARREHRRSASKRLAFIKAQTAKLEAHGARDRGARAHRHRHAFAGRHAGADRQDARARTARGGTPRADRELRDHQRAGPVGAALPERRAHDVLLRDHADQRRPRPRLRGDELRRQDHRVADVVPRADAGPGGLRAVRARLLPASTLRLARKRARATAAAKPKARPARAGRKSSAGKSARQTPPTARTAANGPRAAPAGRRRSRARAG